MASGRKAVRLEEARRKFALATELRSTASDQREREWLEEYAAILEEEGRELGRKAEEKSVFRRQSSSTLRRSMEGEHRYKTERQTRCKTKTNSQ